MGEDTSYNLQHFWATLIERYRVPIILINLLLMLVAMIYIPRHIAINTSTTDMLSQELEWRQRALEYEHYFPQLDNNILIVVESKSIDQVKDSALRLYERLQTEAENLEAIYYPQALPYFRQSGLLFLDQNELQQLSNRLIRIQPALGYLLNDVSMIGLFDMLDKMFAEKSDKLDSDVELLLSEINHVLEDESYYISWERLLSQEDETAQKDIYREFILVKIKDQAVATLSPATFIDEINQIIVATQLADDPTVKVGLTGGIVLGYDELNSVKNANIIAIVLSCLFVGIILWIGLRSLYCVACCLLTLFCGLILTTLLAILTVGTFNLISIAFGVLYIGLGIDFAIHFTLACQEVKTTQQKISAAIRRLFRPLFICACTTAIGFFSFLPTDYQGVAELGLISGMGMFVSFILSFTLLPALLAMRSNSLPYPRQMEQLGVTRLLNIPYQHPKPILIGALLVILLMASQLDRIEFDHNRLNLQDPTIESVKIFRGLLEDTEHSPWQAILLTDAEKMAALKEQFSQLPSVYRVRAIDDLIPKQQEQKLPLIEDLQILLGPLSLNRIAHPQTEAYQDSIMQLYQGLDELDSDTVSDNILRLKANLDQLLKGLTRQKIDDIETRLLQNLSGRISALEDGLGATQVSVSTLPEEIKQRWQNDELYRIQITPSKNISDNEAMNQFVEALQKVAASVTGAPIINVEAGDSVLHAFQSALLYASIAIITLLFILIKIKTDVILIILNLVASSLLTLGIVLIFNIPINFANIIIFPLLLGIGIDSSIHIVERFRRDQGDINILHTSTARGVLFSGLTTIASTANLAYADHIGTANMGQLLTIGILATICSTTMILPALLILQKNRGV